MVRILTSMNAGILAAVICGLGFWLYGFDFSERGGTALGCYAAMLCFAVFGFGFAMMATSKS